MGNFRRDNRSGGRDDNRFGKKDFGKRNFGGRDSGRPQMFSAVCGDCGSPCEVPFRPSGDRPVFCNRCFKKSGGGNKSFEPRFEPRFEPKSRNSEPRNDQFEIINVKLDKIYKILIGLTTESAAQPGPSAAAKEEKEESAAPKPKRKKNAKKVSEE